MVYLNMANRNNGIKSAGRDAAGRFAAGNPGRPPGARHKTTRATLALLEGEAEGLSRKAVEMALNGDTTALRLCLERIAPAKKDTPVQFDLPPMKSAADAAKAVGAVLDAGADGGAKNDDNETPFDRAKKNEKLKGTDAYWALNDAQYD